MQKADEQQRKDAAELLPIAQQELADLVKTYERVLNNINVLVDRTNYELGNLQLAINQKQENIETLKKMMGGYFVPPTPPVSKRMQEEKAASAKQNGAAAAGTPASPGATQSPAPKTNGAAAPAAESKPQGEAQKQE